MVKVDAYNLKTEFKLGKNATIDFPKEDFTVDSQKYYQIITESISNARKTIGYVHTPGRHWQGPSLSIKKETLYTAIVVILFTKFQKTNL
ncbi:hypothetical protein ACGCUQ_07105 [Eubacteriales bacterium KG127]